MTNRQRRRAAKHMKRLQGWLELEMRKWRKINSGITLYNSYAMWRSVANHLRNRILRFKYDE